MLVYMFDLKTYAGRIPHDHIKKEWEILVVCWRRVGSDKTKTLSQRQMCERELIVRLREELDDVDILVHQNGDHFDLRKLTAKLIQYDLPPLSKLQTIDTFRRCREVAAFSSHKLDYVGRFIFDSPKIDTDFQLWIDCVNGDEKAFRKMERYCRHDVKLTEDYYIKTRPYYRQHPNIATNGTENCPFCNSPNTKHRKLYKTKLGIEKIACKCQDCNAPFTLRKIGPRAAETRPISVV